MLRYRLIFGLLFASVLVAVIAFDYHCSRAWPRLANSTPPGTFIALLCILVTPLALREMQALLGPENVTISLRITVPAALLCMLWPWLEQVAETINQEHAHNSPWHPLALWMRTVKPHYLVPTILAASLVAALVMHSRRQKVDGAMANAGGTLLAITYLGVLPGFFLPICMTHGSWMLLAIVGIVKAADVGAYATGRLIGRHKLIPWLSPGKTQEGFVGGLALAAIVAAFVLHDCFPFTYPQALVSGLVLGAVGQLGDLLESLLKRDAGVKDSGKLPGFGGLLDLLDSPLLAAPAAYWLLKLVAHS